MVRLLDGCLHTLKKLISKCQKMNVGGRVDWVLMLTANSPWKFPRAREEIEVFC